MIKYSSIERHVLKANYMNVVFAFKHKGIPFFLNVEICMN